MRHISFVDSFGSRLVYVIGVADSPVKIGIAERLRLRVTQLQIGCPDRLQIFHAVKVPFPLAELMEKEAHRQFAERHRRGEWFDIDRREAAALVDRLKAEMLPEFQHRYRIAGDIVEQLMTTYELRKDVRAAVDHYQKRLATKDDAYAPHANGYIHKHGGMAAYAVFSLVIAQEKQITGLRPREKTSAEAHLARALNLLATFRVQYEKDFATRIFMAECEAMSRDPVIGRHSSLPPVRV